MRHQEAVTDQHALTNPVSLCPIGGGRSRKAMDFAAQRRIAVRGSLVAYGR